MNRLRALAVLIGFLLAVTRPGVASAQEMADPTVTPVETTPSEVPIALAHLAERRDETAAQLRTIRLAIADDETLFASALAFEQLQNQVQRLERETNLRVVSGFTPSKLDESRRQWLQVRDNILKWKQPIVTRLQSIEQDFQKITEVQALWEKSAAMASEARVPEEVQAPIRPLQAGIREANDALLRSRDRLLSMQTQATALAGTVVDALAELDEAERKLRRDLLVADSPPLWFGIDLTVPPGGLDQLERELARNGELFFAFLEAERPVLLVHFVLFVALLALTNAMARRAGKAAADRWQNTPSVLHRPTSAALVLGCLLTFVLYPYAPALMGSLAALLAIAPLARLYSSETQSGIRSAFILLTAMLIAATVRRPFPVQDSFGRLLLLVENVFALGWVGASQRQMIRQLGTVSDNLARRRAALGAVVLLLLTLSFLANVIGNVSLAAFLLEGLAHSAFLGVLLFTAHEVIDALVGQLINAPPLNRIRSVFLYAPTLQLRISRFVGLIAFLTWVLAALSSFASLEPVLNFLQVLLGSDAKLGAVSISLGRILKMLVVLWLSFRVSSALRIILEQDALPRLELPRGVPAAISSGVNYIILLFGLLLALSAAGLDPGRLTILAGALSVGIGFGLQNVVNNFVSGLILLFERPVRLSDIITIGDATGSVTRIGIRSSTIVTFDGAEVILPNGDLISQRVTNWTLSNLNRRFELTVGVAYGSNPGEVLRLLEAAVARVPDVMQSPPPVVLFNGFGASSLDFLVRGWTNRPELIANARSAVGIAIYESLSAAGIAIPFPQQDVHLRS